MFGFFKKQDSQSVGLSNLIPQNKHIKKLTKKDTKEFDRNTKINYEYGYADGFDAGREKGFKEGYRQAKDKFIQLYEEKIQEIKSKSSEYNKNAYKSGYEACEYNKNAILQEAYNDGYEDGCNASLNTDVEDAYQLGYEKGFNAARDELYSMPDIDEDWDGYDDKYLE